jgi:hypothetical protein
MSNNPTRGSNNVFAMTTFIGSLDDIPEVSIHTFILALHDRVTCSALQSFTCISMANTYAYCQFLQSIVCKQPDVLATEVVA